jgi:hypothetical protein
MSVNPAANIVLVHGNFVDGSGWRPVYDVLAQDGYHMAMVQNPTLSLRGDAAAMRLIIDVQETGRWCSSATAPLGVRAVSAAASLA